MVARTTFRTIEKKKKTSSCWSFFSPRVFLLSPFLHHLRAAVPVLQDIRMHHLADRSHVVLQLLPLHRPRQVAHVDPVPRRLGHRGAAPVVLLVHLHLLHVPHGLAHEGARRERLPCERAHGPHLHLPDHLLLVVVHLLVLPAVAPVAPVAAAAAAGGAALAVLHGRDVTNNGERERDREREERYM